MSNQFAIAARLASPADAPGEISDGYCASEYTIGLTVGGKEYSLDGWVVCGWLRPGASTDHDGSGLTNWGDSQPGGWSFTDRDGNVGGRPRVDEGGNFADAITIGTDDNGGQVSIGMTTVPAWYAAGALALRREEEAERLDTDAAHDAASEAIEAAEAIREELVEAINEAIDAVDVDCPEPTAEAIYQHLDRDGEIDGIGSLPIRHGDYLGAGQCIAWRDADGEYDFDFWPTSTPHALAKIIGQMSVDVVDAAVKPADDRFADLDD